MVSDRSLTALPLEHIDSAYGTVPSNGRLGGPATQLELLPIHSLMAALTIGKTPTQLTNESKTKEIVDKVSSESPTEPFATWHDIPPMPDVTDPGTHPPLVRQAFHAIEILFGLKGRPMEEEFIALLWSVGSDVVQVSVFRYILLANVFLLSYQGSNLHILPDSGNQST
jgi:hypothetical protein